MPNNLKLYESLINKSLSEELQSKESTFSIHKKSLEVSESNKVIASYMKGIIEKGLGYYSKDDDLGLEKQIEITNKLVMYFKELVEDDEFAEFEISEKEILKGIGDKHLEKKAFLEIVPQTSIAQSSLFTGTKEDPMVFSELKKEIATAERIDLLVSFIKHSGLRLIYDELVEHARSKPLRVITTSYMGASDYSAIKKLAELPNTEVRISYDTERTRLHAKAYYFHRETGFSTAYIGSSNMSKAALSEGTEWNLKVSEYSSKAIIEKYRATFEAYWNMSEFTAFDPSMETDKALLKKALRRSGTRNESEFYFDIHPFGYQQDILDKLEIEREIHGSHKNLIVAATGTGKTVISAFDFKRFYKEHKGAKLLFLAHRKEILDQSLKTFRGILQDQNFGDLWVGGHLPEQHDHVFASVQTLNAKEKYLQFDKDHFDYIVLDETHHSAALSYKRLIDHYEPQILLGLTATPERMDGENILEFFNHRIVDEIRLAEAIERKMLCPFHYFGVSEDVDLSSVAWKNGRYDSNELNELLIENQARDRGVLSALNKYLPDIEEVKGLGFCAGRAHAKYMSDMFNGQGISSTYLDANSTSDIRSDAAKRLKKGELNFIFVVDLYNEGVDIPEVNTVLFLRPTESPTIFIQQLGRGLRIHEDKEVLTVLDFIGQAHKRYDIRSKMQSLIGRMEHSVKHEIEQSFPSLPKTCFIQLERIAKNHILKNISETYTNSRKLKRMVDNFSHESLLELNLENFLKHYHLEPKSLYKFTTLEELVLGDDYKEHNENAVDFNKMSRIFYKLSDVNSIEWIDFLLNYLEKPRKKVSSREKNMLLMFYYTLHKKPLQCDVVMYLYKFVNNNPSMVNEILALLRFNRERLDHYPKPVVLSKEVPLELHSFYTVDQVLSAVGVHSEDKLVSFREGVKYLPHHECDLFFITLNKNEKQYQKTTMYEDYPISETLFHWQSQSRTSVESPTGQRYIQQKTNGNRVLLFVREHKNDENRMTMPYRCLGFAEYVSHEGTKPISITYKLQDPMPVAIYRESAKILKVI